MTEFRMLGESTVHRGYVFATTVAQFEAPDGSLFERDIVRHPGAVAALPLDGDDVLLVRQYRPAIDTETLEIPAGLRDVEGEPPIETARRELIEEIGMSAAMLEPIGVVHNSVGFSDEAIHLFVATGLTSVERVLTDSPEEVEMTVVRMSIDEALAAVSEGVITDAKTIIALHVIDRRR